MARFRVVLAVLFLTGTGISTARAATWHLYGGGSLGVFTLQPTGAPEGDRSFTAQATLAVEFSLITSPVDARLGVQGNFNQPLQENDFQDQTATPDWGIYVKGKLAFLYAGLGWQRISLDLRSRRSGPLTPMAGWIPFQVVGVEFKLALVSLNFELQRYAGDLDHAGDGVTYRRTLVRALLGLHF